jgi:hypothetical protein
MDFEDLYPGMKVRIIDWLSEDGCRPDHWQEEGEMDEWCNEIVTIYELISENEHVYIEEDGGDWQWYPEDFEHVHRLPKDDPNVQFPIHQHHKRMEEVNRRIDAAKKVFLFARHFKF